MQHTLTESNVFSYLEDRFPAAAGPGERRVEPAGDGNINWVRRVRAGGTSFIVKQAGSALERFPEYAAPPDRILHEVRYYEAVAPFDDERVCPAVHFVDREHFVMILEDLGAGLRLDAALARGDDAGRALCRVARFLGRVHAGTRGGESLGDFPDPTCDGGVLRLHLEHVFRLPFAPNDFPLSPALRAVARELCDDGAFQDRVATLDATIRRRAALIHGDVQPTNILLAERGAVLIDAEIAHAGRPSFDLGSLLAHRVLACVARGRPGQSAGPVARVWREYAATAGEAAGGFPEVAAVMGVEMLRRTLGAARVPAASDDAVALEAVRVGRWLLRERPDQPAALERLG